EQLAELGHNLTGFDKVTRGGWRQGVRSAKSALGLREQAVRLESAFFSCAQDMTADLGIDWTDLMVEEGEEVNWETPYDWSHLHDAARERRRGRDRDRRAA
ncbi:unnamed protein product, partial [Choristocarpus tenellus]